jgi:transcriptional regulator with XRE-family HTH domain
MQDPSEVAAALGRNVRALRQKRRFSIDALAADAGISRGTVIQIESGRANPGIATLVHLAEALGVGVASLIDSGADPKITVRRRESAAALWTSPAGSTAVFLMGVDPPDAVELWDWTLRPGDGFTGEPHPPGTLELLHVLDGALTISLGPGVASPHPSDGPDASTSSDAAAGSDASAVVTATLGPGDTALFEARDPHRYAHADGPVCRFCMTIIQPGDTGIGPPRGIAPADAADRPLP